MAFDAFLKIGDIAGESRHQYHSGWIEVMSFSWGVNQTGAGSTGGGGGAGKASFSNFTIVKTLDKASPLLMLACASGEHLPEVTIEFQRTEGGQQQYLKIKMTEVLISSYRPGGNAQGAEVLPLEEISLNFSKIEFEYTPQKEDGTADAVVHGGWDLAQKAKL